MLSSDLGHLRFRWTNLHFLSFRRAFQVEVVHYWPQTKITKRFQTSSLSKQQQRGRESTCFSKCDPTEAKSSSKWLGLQQSRPESYPTILELDELKQGLNPALRLSSELYATKRGTKNSNSTKRNAVRGIKSSAQAKPFSKSGGTKGFWLVANRKTLCFASRREIVQKRHGLQEQKNL